MKTIFTLNKKVLPCVNLKYCIVTILFLLTLLNVRSYAQMNWNYACVFPGNAYIAASNTNTINPLFSFNLDIFSLECWVCPNDALNPQRQIIMQKAYGSNNYGYCMYLDSGRLAVKTNNITRVISHGMIPSQKWTHVALTFYNERIFSLYINGILDRRDTIVNAFPVANPDSLYIGTGSESNFHGIMDEIRIWHRVLPDTEIYRNFRTTLGTEAGYNQDGYYTGMVLSLTFQTNNGCFNFINPPIMYDWSGCGNVGWPRSVYLTDLSDRPYNTIDNNEAFDNLQGGYAVSANDPLNSPTNAITIELWAYAPDALYRTFVEKGSTSNVDFWLGTGATGVDNIDARINNTILSIGYPMPSGIWEHLAFTYNGTNGEYKFYFNGDLISTSVNNVGPVSNHAIDSFYIGWGPHVPETQLLGFLDEVRISNYIKTGSEIYQDMFRSINCTNVPHPLNNNLCYAFDGYAVDNISSANLPCYFRYRAKFSNPSNRAQSPCGTNRKIRPAWFL